MKKIFLSILILFFVTFPLVSTAQQVIDIPNPFNCNGSQCTLMGLILAIFNNIVLPIAAVGVTLWIVFAGFQFVKAQGNPGDIQKAKQNLLWSLIGAGILLGAAGIAQVVQNTISGLVNIP